MGVLTSKPSRRATGQWCRKQSSCQHKSRPIHHFHRSRCHQQSRCDSQTLIVRRVFQSIVPQHDFPCAHCQGDESQIGRQTKVSLIGASALMVRILRASCKPTLNCCVFPIRSMSSLSSERTLGPRSSPSSELSTRSPIDLT